MRIEQLTFTRFFAAISIIIFHFGMNIFPFNHDSINYVFRQANIGVSYFFILSGFVMIIAYEQKDKINFIEFIKKRIARIYPVYALAIIILFLYYIIEQNKIIYYKDFLLNSSLIQSWIPGKALSFNYPAWSLSTEMFFYLSFPFLFNIYFKNYGIKRIIVSVFFIFIISQFLFLYLINSSFYKGYPSPSHDLLHYFPLMHINEFLIGNAAGLFFLKSKLKRRNYDLLIICLIIILSLLLKFEFNISYHNGILAIIFVPIIILVSLNNGLLSRISTWKPFVFLGEISYGIYILQVPVFLWADVILNTKYFKTNSSELMFNIKLLILILFAGISFRFFETPLRKKISNIRMKGLVLKKTFH